MAQAEEREEHRRETRLLVTTIVVSVGMLLLLARFRFPAEPLTKGPEISPAPLERLAARATYDELARVMADLQARIAPTVAVVPVSEAGSPGYVAAPILTPDKAVAVVSRHARIGGGSSPAPPVIARDPIRDLAVLDLSGRPGAVVTGAATSTPGPRYVVVVEGTAQGPVLRPLYVGRTDLFADPRWTDPVLTIPAVQNVRAGAALFALDGSLIGLVAENGRTATVIPVTALRRVLDSAPGAPAVRTTLGLEVQALTPALARGAGATRGVMVSLVRPEVAGDADLRPGDVIQAIDGIGITTVAGYEEVAQGRTPGTPATIVRVREGQQAEVTIVPVPTDAPVPASQELGAVLRSLRGTGTEVVALAPGGAATRAGLHTGDMIVGVNGRPAPDAPSIERAYRSASQGDVVLLTVQRDGTQRVLALERP
jgi:S1-C subfamily serine protease